VPTTLLLVPHRTQRQQADCLAACAAMVLEYLGQPADYARLVALLDVRDFGAPSSNIRRLAQLGLSVSFCQGVQADLQAHLLRGEPCIVFVRTGELPYWSEDTGHAVVLVGLDDDHVYLNDPAFVQAPQSASLGDFLLAWLEFDYDYAVVTA
jgi:ABC-type bacteriocin/lantibiotic exporter with double-glycine peptidase domain